MIAMMARMDAILESRNLFPGDAFRFTLNQRVALGDAIVRRVADTNAGPSFRYVTRFAFEEDMVNPQSERARLFRCATVKQTLKAVDRAIGGEPLEGRERLAALQNLLVDMLHYLESQEGFHTSLGARRRAKCAPIDPGCIEFGGNQMHVVHKIPGRVRISVPAIRKNKRSAIRLQNELSAQSHIVSASVNESTGSLIIEYSADIAEPELLQLLNQKLQNYS
jgi:hypothetical protein